MKIAVPAAVVGLGVLTGACTVSVDSHSEILREERRFSVTDVADVRVTTFDGSIQVQAWDKPEILVDIEKRGPNREAVDKLEVNVEQTGNVIELEVKRPRSESFSGIGFNRAAYARLFVWVPRKTNIRARSGDGSIDLQGVSGQVEARTGDGRIRASDVAGSLTFDTGDGAVVVDGAEGHLSVDTGDGSVTVSGRLSVVKLHTGDGSIVYRASPGSTMSDNWDITTGDGSVAIYLPADFSGEIDAHTGDGTVTTDLGVEKSPGESRARRTLRGPIGEGGKLLRVRTGDGSIRFKMN